MPIRHCQLCGIKVIVDEDKASVFPFYCDLCSTKTNMQTPAAAPEISPPDEMGMPMAPSFESLTSDPEPVVPPPPPPPVTFTPKPQPAAPSATVACPVCHGEIPVTPASRPIKSRCPICNAELALYPDGSVKTARDAELLKYAKTQEINVRPPTEDLKTKIREMIAEEQRTRMTPQPAPPPPRPVAKPVIPQGPKVVVKGPMPVKSSSQTGTRIALTPSTGKIQAPPPPPPPTPVQPPPPPAMTPRPKTATGKISVPPPPPPAPTDEPALILVESDAPAAPMPEAPVEPEISDEPTAAPIPGLADQPPDEPNAGTQSTLSSVESADENAETSGGILPSAKASQRKTAFEAPKSKFRRVPFFVSLILLLLGPGAGAAVHFGLGEDPSVRKPLEDLGREILLCGHKIATTLFPPEAEKPADGGPAQPTKQQRKTEEELKYLRDEIAVDYDNYLKEIVKTYKKADVSILDNELTKVRTQSVRVQNLINQYKNMSGGKDPDLKAEFKKSLEAFLTDIYLFIHTTEHNARKVTSDIATPMIQRANRAKEDYNKLLAEYESTHGGPIMIDEKTKLVKLETTPLPNPDSDLLQRLTKAYRDYVEAEKEFKKKAATATEFERMMFEHHKQTYEDLKSQYEKKTGKTFEPPK